MYAMFDEIIYSLPNRINLFKSRTDLERAIYASNQDSFTAATAQRYFRNVSSPQKNHHRIPCQLGKACDFLIWAIKNGYPEKLVIINHRVRIKSAEPINQKIINRSNSYKLQIIPRGGHDSLLIKLPADELVFLQLTHIIYRIIK